MKHLRKTLLASLAAMPLAAHAGAPDTEAVEFYNVGTRHYFITATAAEARGIDLGEAGAGWVRTGRSFQAWLDAKSAPADAVPVCRFYSTSANSHFYTASAQECQQLRGLEAAERASSGRVRGWAYEGIAFRVQAPVDGQCPAGTIAVTRVYNDGFANGEGSNHRFTDDPTLERAMSHRDWLREGVAMCVQPKGTGSNANLPPTLTAFESIARTWTGPAKWKVEGGGTESRVTAPLSLTIATDGKVTGTGAGCTFTGSVAVGDGFRSHYEGTLTASGCTNPAFNGEYTDFDLERYGNGVLFLTLQREAAGVEVTIEAPLSNGNAGNMDRQGGLETLVGEWVGTVAWTSKVEGATTETRVSVNQPLTLTFAAGGAVTGTGEGCTFTGTLAPSPSGRFSGTISAAGCTEAGFNGAYPRFKVEREDGGRIEVEIERETEAAGVETKLEIEGTLTKKPAA